MNCYDMIYGNEYYDLIVRNTTYLPPLEEGICLSLIHISIIKERLNKASSMGFMADLKDKYDKEENILMKATVEDLKNFGMIPEFIGRLPILFSLEALDEDMLVRILKEPKNAIIKQYQKLLELDEVKLSRCV